MTIARSEGHGEAPGRVSRVAVKRDNGQCTIEGLGCGQRCSTGSRLVYRLIGPYLGTRELFEIAFLRN